jgi:hypothetical protein
MKKVFLLFFSIFVFLLFTNNVSALDEYRLNITDVNTIDVKKSTNGSTPSTITDYSSVLSYSDGVLTLNEGYHFEYIYADYNNLKITSNNKKVYLNVIISKTANKSATLEDLYSETYVTSLTPEYYYTVQSVKKYIYHSFSVSGNMTINNCNIDLVLRTPASFTSIQNGFILPSYNLTIKNTTIVSDGATVPMEADTTLIIENSSISILNEHGQAGMISMSNGTIQVKDSTIIGKTGMNFSGTGSYLKNSTLDFDGNVYLSSSVDIDDSDITCNNFLYRCPTGNVSHFKNSNLSIKGTFESGLYNADRNWFFSDVLYFEDSTVTSVEPYNLVYGSELHLINTKFEAPNIHSSDGTSDAKVIIEGGETKINYINITGTTQITDATLALPTDGYIKSDGTIDLENVNDLDINYIKGGDISIDTVNINLSGVLSGGDTGIWDSNINTHGTRIVGSFDLFDTYYKTVTLNTENTYSPFIVKGDVDIDNSRLIAVSDGTVPAVLITGNVTLNEGSTFKDDNRKLLTTSNITVSNDNFLSSSSTYGNAEYVSVGDTVKSTTLNNVLTDYAETDGYYEVTLKVVNGTWSDGKSEDYVLKVLLGDKVEDHLPTDMIANTGFTNGKWKNVDGNYVYTFVEKSIINPKTGVISTIGLLIISITMMFIYFKTKNKFSLFKKI